MITENTIGPLISWTEAALRKNLLLGHNLKKDHVLISGGQCINPEYIRLLNRTADVVIDPEFYELLLDYDGQRYLRKLGVYGQFRRITDGFVYFPESPDFLQFDDRDEKRGQYLLEKLGLRSDSKFVTVHSRDEFFSNGAPTEQMYRNSSLENLYPSIDFLKENHLFVIRMGHYRDEDADQLSYISLNSVQSKEDRQFLDFYLQKKAFFSVCGASGIAFIPWQFKTPLFVHNYIPLGINVTMDKGVFIPKLIRRKKDKKWVKLSELLLYEKLFVVLDSHFYMYKNAFGDWFNSDSDYELHDLESVENTESEILEGMRETFLYSQGLLTLSDEQKELQEQFKQMFPVHHHIRLAKGIISPSFLEKYKDILTK